MQQGGKDNSNTGFSRGWHFICFSRSQKHKVHKKFNIKTFSFKAVLFSPNGLGIQSAALWFSFLPHVLSLFLAFSSSALSPPPLIRWLTHLHLSPWCGLLGDVVWVAATRLGCCHLSWLGIYRPSTTCPLVMPQYITQQVQYI